MRKQKGFVCGVIMLVLMLFTSCATGPTTPLSFEDAEAVVDKMLRVSFVYDVDGVLTIYTIDFPDNPTEAELSRVTGWSVTLNAYPGSEYLGPQYPWIEYDQPVTADGMRFATDAFGEMNMGGDMVIKGYVENINGCLVVDTGPETDPEYRSVIPIFGKWKSVAPSLLVGDYIRIGGSGSGNIYGNEDLIIPEQCRNSGITEYFSVDESLTVNCLLEPYCLCQPNPSPECRRI